MKVSTATRLKQLMQERNLKQIDIINQSTSLQKKLNIKMGKSTLSQYVNGKQSPDQDRIFLLSKFFDVSEPWLMGFDVPKDRVPDNQRDPYPISDDINSLYNKLSTERQKKVFNYAKNELEEQNKNDTVISMDNKNDSEEIHTLAAHAADPSKEYSQEEIDNIKSVLDEARKKFENKNRK
ncbi:helix-turn-helix domain-containing protein [Enterococcus mundtii]